MSDKHLGMNTNEPQVVATVTWSKPMLEFVEKAIAAALPELKKDYCSNCITHMTNWINDGINAINTLEKMQQQAEEELLQRSPAAKRMAEELNRLMRKED